MKCRTSAEFADRVLKTENQWKKENKTPTDPDDGEQLWSSQYCYGCYMYYREDQVRDMTEEEIATYKEEQRQKRKAAEARRREKQNNNYVGQAGPQAVHIPADEFHAKGPPFLFYA